MGVVEWRGEGERRRRREWERRRGSEREKTVACEYEPGSFEGRWGRRRREGAERGTMIWLWMWMWLYVWNVTQVADDVTCAEMVP